MGEQADSFFVLIIMEASSDLMEAGREMCAERINYKCKMGRREGDGTAWGPDPVFMFTQSPHVSSK